jgi:capsid protein
MKKRLKNKINKRNSLPPTPEIENNLAIDATRIFSPERNFMLWPSFDPKAEINNWDLETCWRRARALYANSPEVRNAVKQIILLSGYILPLPNTRDKEFNDAARRAFMARAMNPRLFEASGRLNFLQMQKWLEERVLIDGDALAVMTKTKSDNGGMVALYSAPQVSGETNSTDRLRTGCVTGRSGRVLSYMIKDYDSDATQTISASKCVMYSHNPDPADPRTVSELLTGICTAKDIEDINRLNKQQVKLAALFGLVETKDLNDKRSGLNDLIQQRKGNKGCGASEEQPLIIDGVKAISLEPGRKLETLHNTNPSNEIRAFIKDLIRNLAYSLGIDPEVLFYSGDLGGASIRFSLAKAKDFARTRNYDRQVLANRIYQHIISCEIDAGRLKPCKYAEETYNVEWIMRNEWSVDLRHDAQAFISLYNQGLVTGDVWTLSHYGMTFEDVMKKRADEFAHAKMIADEYGLPINLLIPNQLGGTPIDWEGTHECHEDIEPETVEEEEETTN